MATLRQRDRGPKSSSFASVAALGLLAVTAGAFTGNWLALAFGLPFLVGPVLLYAAVLHSIRHTRVTRVALDAVFEGEEVAVTLRLENRSRIPLFFPVISDDFRAEYYARKTCIFADRILAGEEVEGRYLGHCLLPRGRYPLGPGVLSISDPFGWIQLNKRIPVTQELKVYPAIRNFGLRDRSRGPVMAMRDDRTCSRSGESQEFFSVREYRVGDPLRRIHWGLSAHRGIPVVREYTQHSRGNLTVFLDLHRKSLMGIGRGSSLEHSVRICVALCNHALRNGHQCEVVAQGQGPCLVPPGRGLVHLRSILDTIVDVRPDGARPLPELLNERRASLRGGDTVVYPVSPYLCGTREFENFLAEVRSLRSLGVRQVAIVFDEKTFRSLSYEDSLEGEGATEIAQVLQTLGVECYLVSCGANLEAVFR